MGAVETLRDALFGNPPAANMEPSREGVLAAFTELSQSLEVLSLGGLLAVTKDTRAHLNADLAYGANSVALVYADATDANNDLYVKVGASGTGSWTLTSILHDSIEALAQPYVDDAETAASSATASAATLTVLLPSTKLPASVEALYFCDEGAGTTLHDVVHGHTATLAAIGAVGTIGWTKDGWLKAIGAAFLLPAMSHRAIGIIYRMPETDDTSSPLFCSSSSEMLGRRMAAAASISAVRLLDGWGITTPRISSTGVMVAMEGGGWQFPVATFTATRSSAASIGSDAPSPAVRAAEMEIAGIVVFNTTASNADLRQVLDFMRPRAKVRGIYLSPFDCPDEATLIVSDGESTDDGRFSGLFTGSMTGTTATVGAVLRGQVAEGDEWVANGVSTGRFVLAFGTAGTTGTGGVGTYALDGAVSTATGQTFTTMGLSAAQRDAVAESLLVNAYNSTTLVLGRRMARYSTKPPYANSSAVASGPTVLSGWDIGLRDSLIQRPHDGRKKHLLKLGMGSTYLTRAGDGVSTFTSVVTKGSFSATISTTTMTVAGGVTGAIMPGDVIVGSGVTASSVVQPFGTGGTTGTGGNGTYRLSQSSTVASPTAMTSTLNGGMIQALSRHPGVMLPFGLTSTVHERYLRKSEVHARNEGVGYTTVIFCTGEGINDASLGDNAIASAAAYQALLQAKYDYYGQVTGIDKPTWILLKPHLPYGSVSPTGDLGGPDTDYPNNQMGQSRLNALNFIRTACESVKTANIGTVFTLDGNLYDTNNGTDYVHPSAPGNVAMGKGFDAIMRKTVRFTASASGTTLTVTGVVANGAIEVGFELTEGINASYLPRGVVIRALGTGTGGSGTYTLSQSQTFAASPMSTVELYRKRIVPAA